MKESRQEGATRRILEAAGVEYRKDGRVGWPDRIALLGGGRHAWVEHKTERGRLTPAQRRVIPRIEAMGDLVVYGKRMAPEEIAAAVLGERRRRMARAFLTERLLRELRETHGCDPRARCLSCREVDDAPR